MEQREEEKSSSTGEINWQWIGTTVTKRGKRWMGTRNKMDLRTRKPKEDGRSPECHG